MFTSLSMSSDIFNIVYSLNKKKEINYNNNSENSIYDLGVLMSDGGANIVIIRDEELFNKRKFKRIIKYIKVTGVSEVSLMCEGVGYLMSPFENLMGMYVPSFKANIIGEVAARRQGFKIKQDNDSDNITDDILRYHNSEGRLIAKFERGSEMLWCFKPRHIQETLFVTIVSSESQNNNIELAHIELENVKSACAELMKLGYNFNQIARLILPLIGPIISEHRGNCSLENNQMLQLICGLISEN